MSKTNNIIRLDELQLREHLDRKITESVEETLNGLLEAGADRLFGAGRYERYRRKESSVEEALMVPRSCATTILDL